MDGLHRGSARSLFADRPDATVPRACLKLFFLYRIEECAASGLASFKSALKPNQYIKRLLYVPQTLLGI